MADRASPAFRFNPPSPPSQSIHEYVDESDGHRSRSSPPASFEVIVERPPSLSPVLEDLQGLPRSPEARAFQSPGDSPRRGRVPIGDPVYHRSYGLATHPMDGYVPSYEEPPHSQSRNPSPHHYAYRQGPSMYHENVSYGRTSPGSLRHASTHSSSSHDKPTFDTNPSPHSSASQQGLRQPYNPVVFRASPAQSYQSYIHTYSVQPVPGEYYASPVPPEDVAPVQISRAPLWTIFSELPRVLRQQGMPHQYTQIGPTDPSYPALSPQVSVTPAQDNQYHARHYKQHSGASAAYHRPVPLYQNPSGYPYPSDYLPHSISAFHYEDPRLEAPIVDARTTQAYRARVSVDYVPPSSQPLGSQQQLDDFRSSVAPSSASFQGGGESSPDVLPLQSPLVDTAPRIVRSGGPSNNLDDFLPPLSGDDSQQLARHSPRSSLSRPSVRSSLGEKDSADEKEGAPSVNGHLGRQAGPEQAILPSLSPSAGSPIGFAAMTPEETAGFKSGYRLQDLLQPSSDAMSDHVCAPHISRPVANGPDERDVLSNVVGEAFSLKRNEVGFRATTISKRPSSIPPTPKESRKAKLQGIDNVASPKQQHQPSDDCSILDPDISNQQATRSPMGEAQLLYGTSPYSYSVPLRPESAQSDTSSMLEARSTARGLPNHSIWDQCKDEAKAQDERLMQQWNNAIDVLLMFAALFSAVLTAFLMEFYKFLEPEPETISSQLLQNIATTLQILVARENLGELPSVSKSMESHTSTAVLWVNGQWFVSLTCSIGVAMSGMVVKQWLQYYDRDMGGLSAYEYVQRRQYRYSGLLKWKVPMIVTALPIAMHVSVTLFLSGMVLQLWQINDRIAMAVLVMLALYGSAYVFVTVAPLFDPECPYKSPMAIFLQRLTRLIAALPLLITMTLAKFCNAVCRGLALRARMSSSALLPILKKIYGYSRVTAESREIGQKEATLKADGILWMLNSCQNLNTVDEALKVIASLECDEAVVKKFHTFDVPELLVSRASLPLPSLEHEFWSRLPVLDKKTRNAITSSSAPAYLGSLLRLWHHPTTYDIMSQDPFSITRASGMGAPVNSQKHQWIFGNWVYAWRQLCMSMESGLPWSQIQNLGWSKEIFAAFLCTEATYYHLCSSKTQKFPQASPTDDPWDKNPFPDIQHLLNMHMAGTLTLDERLLVIVLDTLLFLLANVNSPADLVARRDLLITLLKLMSSEESQDIAVVRRSVAIIEMFASKAGDQMQVYRAHIGSRGVLRRQEAYASIKQSICFLLNESCREDARSKKLSENTTTRSETLVDDAPVSNVINVRGLRFPFITRLIGGRVKRSGDLEIGSCPPSGSSDVSRATPNRSLQSHATFVDRVKETVQPNSTPAVSVHVENDSPLENPMSTSTQASTESGPGDTLKLVFSETVEQFFLLTVRHNASDFRGGDLLLNLPTKDIPQILSHLPKHGDMTRQWDDFKSLAWLLHLLLGWSLRGDMPSNLQTEIIATVNIVLEVLGSQRRTEFTSKVLPLFAERLRKSEGLESDLICLALCTVADRTTSARSKRRFLSQLVRAGIIQILDDRLRVHTRLISAGPWNNWRRLVVWWEENLAESPAWTAEEQKVCGSIAKVFRVEKSDY